MPLRYSGSSMLNVLAETDGLVRMEIGVSGLARGEVTDVRLVRP
jgi:molybdopterin biosynthesis enzyme